MKKINPVLLTILLIFGISSQAPASCYSAKEAEAEQGIRIHSELMVIGLSCMNDEKFGKGHDLYAEYRKFTSEHGDLFAAYEKILLDIFKRDGLASPEDELNALRTRFANRISIEAAKMRPDVFCARYAPRIEKAAVMERQDIRKWAATIYQSHPVSRPLCASVQPAGG